MIYPLKKLVSSLALISFTILSYELLILRVISIIYEYDLLFIIISLSICGIGAGGIFYYKFFSYNNEKNISFRIFIFLFPFSFTISLYILINHFYQITLFGSILTILLPFFIGGILISSIFAKNSKNSSIFYFFDLAGGACGCLFSIPIMKYLGGINSILFVSIIASIVVIILRNNQKWFIKSSPVFITLIVFCININYKTIDLGYDTLIKTETPLGQTLNYPGLKTEWISNTWDIYSRCDLVKASKGDIKRSIFINGGTKATMMRFDNKDSTKKAINRYLESSILFFPYLFDNNKTILNIGSGGGRDILLALLSGAKKITGVEINKGVINMVKKEKEYNGNIYGQKNVNLVVEDGRTFIIRSNEKYDRIVLSLASTFAFSDMSGMAQMENYLYTEEAFKDYLRHLTENGTLIIFIDFSELVEKFIMTALKVLKSEFSIGYDRAMDYISAFETEYVSGYGYVFMMKASPYSKETVKKMKDFSESYGLVPVHIPYIKSGNDFDLISQGKLTPETYIKNNSSNLAPSTDNSPFFLEVVFNYRLKLIILLTSIIIILLTLIIFFQAELTKNKNPPRLFGFILYFVFIGIGFMLVEIMLTKRFSFYLGYPHLNIAIILFTILLGTGIGSLLSARIKFDDLNKKTCLTSFLVILILLIFELTSDIFIHLTIGLPILTRVFLIILYLLPVSVPLGFFFPSGLKMIGNLNDDYIPWFWGINGIASVTGSVASIVIAMSYGFQYTLYTAMIFYAGVGTILFSFQVNDRQV